MANLWIYEQKFNGLTDGDLNGQDSWSGSTLFDVTTETSYEGTKDLRHGGSTSSYTIVRNIDSITSGTFSFSLKANGTTGARFNGVTLQESAAGGKQLFFVGLDPLDGGHAGDITANGVDGIHIIGTYSADTWVRLTVAFECGAGSWEGLSSKTFKVKINNGSWSSAFTFQNNINAALQIRLDNYGTGAVGSFDYISPNYSDIIPNSSNFFQLF